MIEIKPKYVYDEDNKKQGVVLTIKDFEKLTEELEDYYDYKMLEKRRREPIITVSLEEIKAKYLRKK